MILLTQQINRNDNAKDHKQNEINTYGVQSGSKQPVSISVIHKTNKLHAHWIVFEFTIIIFYKIKKKQKGERENNTCIWLNLNERLRSINSAFSA